ncbi:MAG: hypothetical protein KGY69_01770 [Bacteroidales bacterium]|nr:hypothetical protein [Bacteroidales bacterium]
MMIRLTFSFFVGLWFILLSLPSSGQRDTLRERIDNDKRKYEEIMESETEEISSDGRKLHQYYLLPEELPEWFFNPSVYSTASVSAIGISEPGMDSANALELAVLRAKSIAILSKRSRIDYISDHFQVVGETDKVSGEHSRNLDFSRIHVRSLIDDEAFTVNEVFYTKYGEAIALVSYAGSAQKRNDTLSVSGEIMHLTREASGLLNNTVLCRLDIHFAPYDTLDVSPAESHFTLRRRGKRFNIHSLYNSDSVEFPFHPYRYNHSMNEVSDTTFSFQSCPLKLGLWNAYINLLFSKLSYYHGNLESRVKVTYDNYNLKDQGLIRTISGNSLRFSMDSLAIEDNELFQQIEIIPY